LGHKRKRLAFNERLCERRVFRIDVVAGYRAYLEQFALGAGKHFLALDFAAEEHDGFRFPQVA
jgi:hypothetical protein